MSAAPQRSALAVRRDPALVARVARRLPLHYDDGGDPHGDRARHVRAGSGLAWLGAPPSAELVVAQDDASFLAVLDPARGCARALPLDHVVSGRRVFESRLGNKQHKLDLEACARLPDGRVLVVGSGSLPVRERVVVVAPGHAAGEGGHADVVSVAPLYAALRARADFAGSELNVEGAAVLGARLVLVNRGNGAPTPERAPADALAFLDLDEVLAFLGRGGRGAPPAIREVVPLTLGAAHGVLLTPTDACARGGALWLLAAAEASPNAIDDGAVVATAIARVDLKAREVRLGAVLDEDGRPFRDKVEGLAWASPDGAGTRALAVVDRDDPDAATELLVLEIPSAA